MNLSTRSLFLTELQRTNAALFLIQYRKSIRAVKRTSRLTLREARMFVAMKYAPLALSSGLR